MRGVRDSSSRVERHGCRDIDSRLQPEHEIRETERVRSGKRRWRREDHEPRKRSTDPKPGPRHQGLERDAHLFFAVYRRVNGSHFNDVKSFPI